jgi:hypothetical protein
VPYNLTVEAVPEHDLKVSLVAIKDLVTDMVLPQDLVWPSEGHFSWLSQSKSHTRGTGLCVWFLAHPVHFLAWHTLLPIRLVIQELA